MVNNLGPTVPRNGNFGRIKCAFSDQETSTINYVPDTLTFIDDEDEKIYKKIQKKINNGKELNKTDIGLLKVDRIIWKPPTEDILPFLEESIREHFEARIQIIYQQMLLVFRKKFKFVDHYKADAQVGECPTNIKYALGSYECAHSSTLPALRTENPDDPNTLIAFGQGSYFHKTWNATVFLPEEVNAIDSALDKFKKFHDDKTSFRQVALGLLNSVSKGRINPKEGLLKFLDSAISVLGNISKEKDSVEHQQIIKQYIKTAKEWKKNLKESDLMIKQMSPLKKKKLKQFKGTFLGAKQTQFFQEAHEKIYAIFKKEMDQLKPVISKELRDSATKNNPNAIVFKKIIHKKITDLGTANNHSVFSSTVQKYSKSSQVDEKLKLIGRKYLHKVSKEVLNKDLEIFSNGKKGKFSEEAKKLQSAVMEHVSRSFHVSRPQKPYMITLKFLELVSVDVCEDQK